jgi:hypothetical protein
MPEIFLKFKVGEINHGHMNLWSGGKQQPQVQIQILHDMHNMKLIST